MTFALNLRAARHRLQLHQRELALILGVSSQSVSNWECGRTAPWPKNQADILLRLELMAREEEKRSQPAPRTRVCERLSPA